MNKLEKLYLDGVPEGTEVTLEGGTIVLRRIVDVKKFRKIAAEVLRHLPKVKKGESIVRELDESRLRDGR